MDVKPLFMIMIDGLGYYQIAEEQMPFLRSLLSEDKHRLRTPLGYSGPIQTSLFTGCNPRTHGVWNYILRRPNESSYSFIRHMPWLIRLDRIDKRLTVPFKFLLRFLLSRRNSTKTRATTIPLLTPSEQLMTLSLDCPPLSPQGRFGVPSIFDILKGNRIPYNFVFNSKFGRIRIDAEDIPLDSRFVYVLISVDEYFHHKGVGHEETLRHMKHIDAFLETLFSRMRKELADFSYVVLSDHGFYPIQRRVNMEKYLKDTDSSDYIMFTDATMARFWFSSKRSRQEVEDRLSSLGFGKVLDNDLKREFGIDFTHNFYGDIIFLFDPGVVPVPDSWGMCMSTLHPLVGAHGYDPREELSHGFISTNIGVKGDTIRIVDVLPSVLAYWGLEMPRHIEGVSRR
jgi:hypothetical protein